MAGRWLPNNTQQAERGIRIVPGVGLLPLTVLGSAAPWGHLGLIPLITGLVGSGPLCTLLGATKCRVKAY